MNRYTRQMVLPQVGRDGQDRIEAAHVLVVGAGVWACRCCNIWPAPASARLP